MSIDVAWGTAERSSRIGAFDAALAAAGAHNYNLVAFSSVVPAGTAVREVDTLSADWPVGERAGVVLARSVARDVDRVVAGLGWALAEEGGILVEGSGHGVEACRREIETAIAEARDLREWDWAGESRFRVVDREVDDGVGAAVVVAAYGPIAGPTDP